jgi:hypothetical protein
MYMQEALEMVCRRRRLQAKEYVLLLSDMSILIPLDRTVASLQGKSDLMLVKRSMLPHLNVDVRPFGRSTDPNGTFFFLFPCPGCTVRCLRNLLALTVSSCRLWCEILKQRRSSSACPTHQISTLTPRKISLQRTRSVSKGFVTPTPPPLSPFSYSSPIC